MKDANIKILKDKVKYLLEMEAGKQYLLVFDIASRLTRKDIENFNKMLEDRFDVKIVSLLLNGIDSMRVLTLEETKK